MEDDRMTPAEMRDIREAAGLTQSELAQFFRLSGSRTIRRYEMGEREPPGPVILLYELLRTGAIAPARDRRLADAVAALGAAFAAYNEPAREDLLRRLWAFVPQPADGDEGGTA